MGEYRADLHVHLGSDPCGRPVKVTASRSLTLDAVLRAGEEKGLDLVGLVDAVVPAVSDELGRLAPVPGGGYQGQPGGLVLLPGAEMESGGCHYLALFGRTEELAALAAVLHPTLRNPHLSTQVTTIPPAELARVVHAQGGIFILAHAFTPHKGYFGKRAALGEVFPAGAIDGVELGLSADTEMADSLSELAAYPYLSNSDAHSAANVGREFMLLALERPSFAQVCRALLKENGRGVLANYGLDPRLGKYHRTACGRCGWVAVGSPPVLACPECAAGDLVLGVADRLATLASGSGATLRGRPPYKHQVPLNFIPGLGRAGREKLVRAFGNELAALHEATAGDLAAVVGPKAAALILDSREGRLKVACGGGGVYGKVLT